MRDRGLRALPWLALAVSVAAAILLLGSGDEEPPAPAPAEITEHPAGGDAAPPEIDQRPAQASKQDDVVVPERQQRRRASETAAAERVYRNYIAAINARDGDALLALLGPAGVEALELPVERGAPEERLSRSIGYPDPRGYPVWAGTTLASIDSAEELPSGTIQVTATIVTDFADRPEPSVETDVAYLGADGTLLKPTAAIYRAVGKPDVPPSVIAAP